MIIMLTHSEIPLFSSPFHNLPRASSTTSREELTLSESGPYSWPVWSGSLKYRAMNWGLGERGEREGGGESEKSREGRKEVEEGERG